MHESLEMRVARVLCALPGDSPLVAGFSGGLDSTLLCESLIRAGVRDRLLLVHVDHQLHPDSSHWAQLCADYARQRDLPFRGVRVRIPGRGNLEEQARRVRRRALLGELPAGGALLLAHHADDQAETLLLRLMRGAGVQGMAGMDEYVEWQGHPVLRPFIGVDRATLEKQARAWGLSWIEDPANRDERFDRSFLRRRVMPLLEERWSGVPARLGAAASAFGESGQLLDERAAEDFRDCRGQGDCLELAGFEALSTARRRNLLHWWLRRRGMRSPGRRLLARLDDEVLGAAADRQPRLAWREGCFARHAGRLYLLSPRELEAGPAAVSWSPEEQPRIRFGPGWLGMLEPPAGEAWCLALPGEPAGFRVATARGGEQLRIGGMHRRLVELWRQRQVPPWRRAQLPLFFHGDELVAAAGAGVDDRWHPASDAARRQVCWWPEPGGADRP